MERSSLDWDYGLFGVNYIHPHLLKNNLWRPAETLKTFYHRRNPVAILVKRPDKTDFYGISEIKDLNLHRGIAMHKLALLDDRNNVWMYVNPAKAKLKNGDKAGFTRILNEGKEIFPYYEPFYLLDASQLFDQGEYRESMRKLNEWFEINSKYHPAEKLYKAVKEKNARKSREITKDVLVFAENRIRENYEKAL